jgi:plasmid stability protein
MLLFEKLSISVNGARVDLGYQQVHLPAVRIDLSSNSPDVIAERSAAHAAAAHGCLWSSVARSASGHRRNPRSIAKWRLKRHNGAMPSVQIKDVPEHTHAVLRQRAAAAHQSLQEYLRTKLIQEASAPTVDEVLDRAGGRAGGRVPIKTATEILREDRDRR